MTFFNTVFREILSDPFMMAPMTQSMTPMMGPTQQMARMVRMMDSMMVSDMPMQMPVRRNGTCPVHTAAKTKTQTRQVATTQTRKNVDKPVSWTVKMNADKPQPTVPRERAASTTRGPRLLIMVRREDRCGVSSVSSPLSNWFSVVRPGQAPTHAQCALQ